MRQHAAKFLLTLCLVACSPSADVMRLENAPRPARSAEDVQVLMEEPVQAYTTVAVVSISDEGWGMGLEKLKTKAVAEAAKLGGDAVILGLASREAAVMMMPVGGGGAMAAPIEEKKLMGKVIAWKKD